MHNLPFTTLAKIRAAPNVGGRPLLASPNDGSNERYVKLLRFLGPSYYEDTPISVAQIVESNGLEDALRCLRTMPEWDSLWRHFAVDCAERVVKPDADPDTKKALVAAREFAACETKDYELDASRWAAVRAERRAAKVWLAREAARAEATRLAEEGWQAWSASRAAIGAASLRVGEGASSATSTAIEAVAVYSPPLWASTTREEYLTAKETEWQTARLLELCAVGAWSPVK